MHICDRCQKGGNIRIYCFGMAAADFPGVAHHDLCPDCAKEFAQMFDDFVKANNETNDDR